MAEVPADPANGDAVRVPVPWSALTALAAERDRLAAQLAAVREALLQGGQAADIRCRAALIAASPSTPEETP